MKPITSSQNIQSILSIGYIYLIIMGILNESLYFSQLDIDILNYSSILDVLISPISKLTSSRLGFFFFILLLISVFILPKKMIKYKDSAWFKKSFKLESDLEEKEMESAFFKTFVFVASMGLLGFFVGTGLGTGFKTVKKIENKEIEYNDTIHFLNGEVAEVEVLGKNSTYLFYLTKANNTVNISPFSGVIQRIEEVK